MDYKYQLEYKQQEIVNNLKRIGKIVLPEVTSIAGCASQYFYPNKMKFEFSDSKWLTLEQIRNDEAMEDRNALGFRY